MLEQQMAAVLGTGRWCSGRVACVTLELVTVWTNSPWSRD
jgi:hypothetical protein